jgi:hypothetical protein
VDWKTARDCVLHDGTKTKKERKAAHCRDFCLNFNRNRIDIEERQVIGLSEENQCWYLQTATRRLIVIEKLTAFYTSTTLFLPVCLAIKTPYILDGFIFEHHNTFLSHSKQRTLLYGISVTVTSHNIVMGRSSRHYTGT